MSIPYSSTTSLTIGSNLLQAVHEGLAIYMIETVLLFFNFLNDLTSVSINSPILLSLLEISAVL